MVQEEIFQACRFGGGSLAARVFPTGQHEGSANLLQSDLRIFPPQLPRVQTDESQGYQAQRPMTFQRYIAASLEVGQADFALGHAEHMFHIPAHERGPQHATQADASWRIGEEYFFSCLPIPAKIQSVSRPAVGPHRHIHDLRLPHRRRAGLLLEAERLRRSFLHARLSKHSLGA